MPESSNRERDLVLAPNEFAFISDQTKGQVNVYVGPYKTSLANTDQPVVFNERSKRFERCTLEQATQIFAIAPEGWYLVMKNPARDGNHPKLAFSNSLTDLDVGHKVNISGPTSFALWPGQMIRIVPGHTLHYNQYLIVRVYDEEAAKKNWEKAIIKPQTKPASGLLPGDQPAEDIIKPALEPKALTTGRLLMVQGTDVSFYIPPTGVEVVRDANDNYVREAVSLERLEYCILLDEDGNKRFVRGPAVVFPRPSETFVEKSGQRKFKAIELNEISGLYIKVIAAYTENGREYKEGEELFITGKDQMIYFPRPEHAIIKYGEQEIHYAVAIPAGEGRYSLNRTTGKVTLIKGPAMYLPDPRTEVVVRRILEPKQVQLWFPGNQEALEYNLRLKQMTKATAGTEEYLSDGEVKKAMGGKKSEEALRAQAIPLGPPPDNFAGDDFTRKTGYTPPRTIVLDTKYEGAVAIDCWTGYAVLVVSRTGERKVIVGPRTYLMEYDEYLEAMELSTGTPKSDDKKIKTGYLRVLHNKVSDLVQAESKDLCQVQVRLSYRVNFEGEPEKWFDVENYVKFLTDHMRSLLRHAIKQHGIESFYAEAIRIVRDTVLGVQGTEGKRPGRKFEENGMRVYDVEVLDVKIGDDVIAKLLIEAQHSVVKQTLEISSEKRREDFVAQTETIKQKIAGSVAETRQKDLELATDEAKAQLVLNLAKLDSEIESRKRTLEARLADQEKLSAIDKAELTRKKEAYDLEIDMTKRKLDLEISRLKAEVQGVVDRAEAVSPDLIAALQAFGDKNLAEKMAESMAPLAILGGKSIAEVFAQLVKGTALEDVLKKKIPAAHPPTK